MVINIFEAGRRTSRLVAAIWIISWIIKAIDSGFQDTPIVFAGLVFGGVLFIFIFSKAIGRIVRFFMGISRGLDQKEKIN
jgi:hypothetical protein